MKKIFAVLTLAVLIAPSLWASTGESMPWEEGLQKILDNGGPAYTVHNPRTWSAQAKLADEGNWEELHIWQKHLRGGV